jgi:uncharacterized protein YjgD (DUF1641 family)
VKVTVEKFKQLFKAQNEEFETSAFEFENKTIENVINDLKTSFNLSSLEEEEQTNSNFKTGNHYFWLIEKFICMGNICWRLRY